MTQQTNPLLADLASKYIWWKTPDEAMDMPQRVIAQVMNIGDYHEVQRMAHAIGDDALRDAIKHAEAGQFIERSWAYWHYRLAMAELDELPLMPVRRFA